MPREEGGGEEEKDGEEEEKERRRREEEEEGQKEEKLSKPTASHFSSASNLLPTWPLSCPSSLPW